MRDSNDSKKSLLNLLEPYFLHFTKQRLRSYSGRGVTLTFSSSFSSVFRLPFSLRWIGLQAWTESGKAFRWKMRGFIPMPLPPRQLQSRQRRCSGTSRKATPDSGWEYHPDQKSRHSNGVRSSYSSSRLLLSWGAQTRVCLLKLCLTKVRYSYTTQCTTQYTTGTHYPAGIWL